jgi:DNA-binding response OmpR family regulator
VANTEESRGVVALLKSRAEHEDALRGAAASAGFRLEVVDSLPAAIPRLTEKATRAVLVDGAAAGAEELCQTARVGRFPGDLVVLVGAKKPDDTSFAQAYDWGADDVVTLDSELGMSIRLGRLPRDTALPPRARGSALVAEPDAKLAARVERMLGYAGYDVACVLGLGFSHERVPSSPTSLVLLSSELGDPVGIVQQLRASGNQAVLLVWTRPQEVEPLTRALGSFDRVAVLSRRAPVESVLFLSNQLMSGPNDAAERTEPRFLYGTTVAFREAGAEEDDYGFTYNVGPQGLYVRTLAVPDQAKVWIELYPPGGRWRVRLAGEVVWSRPFGFASDALAPPGFGMRVSAGLLEDYQRWLEDLARTPTGVHARAPG